MGERGTYDYRKVVCTCCGWRGRRGYRVTWPPCPRCIANADNVVFENPEEEKQLSGLGCKYTGRETMAIHPNPFDSKSPEELKAEIRKARLQLELETEKLCLLGLQCFIEVGRLLTEKKNSFESGEVATENDPDAIAIREFHQKGIVSFLGAGSGFAIIRKRKPISDIGQMFVKFVENPVWGKDVLKRLNTDSILEVLDDLDSDEREEMEDSIIAIINKMFEKPFTEIMLQ